MHTQRVLFTNKEKDHWETQAEQLGYEVRKELTANGSYFVAYIKESKNVERVYGLFSIGDEGGYLGRSINKVSSARMILKSFKQEIADLSRAEFVLHDMLCD